MLLSNYNGVVFRYRKWKLRDAEVRDGERIEGVTLVARCEHDAVLRGEQGDVFINIKACNEWDSKVSMSKVITANVGIQSGISWTL